MIIAEGFEEKPYIDKILSFPNISKDTYHFAPAVNAKGNGNIVARYQFEIQRGFYDAILIFCDADKGSEQFMDLVEKVGKGSSRAPRTRWRFSFSPIPSRCKSSYPISGTSA